MRKNIAKVIAAFNAGKSAVGDAKRSCSTDGTTIFSYRMPIAWRDESGKVHVVSYYDATSATTRTQVSACRWSLLTPSEAREDARAHVQRAAIFAPRGQGSLL